MRKCKGVWSRLWKSNMRYRPMLHSVQVWWFHVFVRYFLLIWCLSENGHIEISPRMTVIIWRSPNSGGKSLFDTATIGNLLSHSTNLTKSRQLANLNSQDCNTSPVDIVVTGRVVLDNHGLRNVYASPNLFKDDSDGWLWCNRFRSYCRGQALSIVDFACSGGLGIQVTRTEPQKNTEEINPQVWCNISLAMNYNQFTG